MRRKTILTNDAIVFGLKKTLEHIRLLGVVLLVCAGVYFSLMGFFDLFFDQNNTLLLEQNSLLANCFAVCREFCWPYLYLLFLVFFCVFCFGVIVLFNLGLKAIALNIYDNNTSSIGVLFSQLRNVLKSFVACGLFCLMLFGGLALCIIPGVIVLVRFYFFNFFIIDKGAGPIEALRMSYDATKGHFWKLFIFIWSMRVVERIGSIFVLPSITLADVHVYRQMCPANK